MNRILLENYVIAWNTALRGSVQHMDVITLLRNSHPSYRDVFARLMMDDGEITKDECNEFIKMIGAR